jgi:hypothetical protein
LSNRNCGGPWSHGYAVDELRPQRAGTDVSGKEKGTLGGIVWLAAWP